MTSSSPYRPLRRRVLYLPGYATADPERHRRLFAREAAAFARLWEVEVDVSPLEPAPDGHGARWRVDARIGGKTVASEVEVLRWDDLVAADFRRPLLAKLGPALAALADGVASGALRRVARAAPWFAVAYLYPYAALLLCVLLGTLAGVAVPSLPGGAWTGVAVGAAVALGALEALRRAPSFVVHLLDDWIAQRRYRRRRDPALDERLARFAARLGAAARADDADEILVVGHSSGAMFAIDVVARALAADPDLGRRGPRLSLLTAGGAELLVALHPDAAWFRDRMARLAVERDLHWAAVAGRWDTLCFPELDPVAELNLVPKAERRNPRFVRFALRRVLTAETIDRLRRGLRVFRVHFQYVMANERRGPYDFFSLVCGEPTFQAQLARRKGDAMSPYPLEGLERSGLRGP